jgi:hypothetical protein
MYAMPFSAPAVPFSCQLILPFRAKSQAPRARRTAWCSGASRVSTESTFLAADPSGLLGHRGGVAELPSPTSTGCNRGPIDVHSESATVGGLDPKEIRGRESFRSVTTPDSNGTS